MAEWSDHYIDYAELKKLLSKVKHAIQRYEEQAKKKPDLAKEIKANYDKGISAFVTGTPPMSSNSLPSMANIAGGTSPNKGKPQQESKGDSDERTALLTDVAKRVSGIHGAVSPVEGQQNSPGSGVHGVLRHAVSSVYGYFEKRYETSIRDTLGEISALENEFDNCLLKEVS